MKKALKFLKKNIQPSMPLSEMVNIFEEMSKMPIDTDDETLLMDTCIYDPSFSGKIVHNFFLVRQVPDKKGEYFQLHLDVTLETEQKEISFPSPIWSDAIDGNFFDSVRSSDPYLQAIKEKVIKVEVHLSRT